MKIKTGAIIMAILMFSSLRPTISLDAQKRIYLSGKEESQAVNWQFKISGGARSDVWSVIPVPSNWEFHGFGTHTYGEDFTKGRAEQETGCYKYTFKLNKETHAVYKLCFEGVLTDACVKVNGHSAGPVHKGGYTPFQYDISTLLTDGKNILEVEVLKKSANPAIRAAEQMADYWVTGGIYRPVYIDVLPSRHIERVAINAEMDGSFEMDTWINKAPSRGLIRVKITSSSGDLVGIAENRNVKEGQNRINARFEDIVPWNHEHPALYHAEVILEDAEQVVHTLHQRFGFRTFEVRDHDGFYLNGERVLLKGVNLHSWHPETGRCLSKRHIEKVVGMIKDLNCNTIRPCHYPPDSYLFDLCDSMGILAMDEITGWIHPLPTTEGARMVKEMVTRDVNHPSIILWGNGNHRAHNPSLDSVFRLWDIQNRRPLKNGARKEDMSEGYYPPFDIVDTRYYPDWDSLLYRLHHGGHIVMPNEILHALYDGGGGANAGEYWEQFLHSKYGGGMMIWAFLDEGAVRWDRAGQMDVFGSMYPDGIVGPYGEKEGSFAALREVWSPVHFTDLSLTSALTGVIPVENRYHFTNLKDCVFKWKLQNFSRPNEAYTGSRVQFSGIAKCPDIAPGYQGELRLQLPENWTDCDALSVAVFDPAGRNVTEGTVMISDRKQLTETFRNQPEQKINVTDSDVLEVTVGNMRYAFNKKDGILEKVMVGHRSFPVSRTPFLVHEEMEGLRPSKQDSPLVSWTRKKNQIIIHARNSNGFDWFRWTIEQNGNLRLSYSFILPPGQYAYAGIGIAVPAAEISGKKWLGEGPYRIWKNRKEGGLLDVWELPNLPNVPGEIWNMPEFEGYFHPWYWATIQFRDGLKMALASEDSSLSLGVLTPVNGADPKQARWKYPAEDGIFLFHCISPVGSKWKDPDEFGPQGQANVIDGKCTGSLDLNFTWNQGSDAVRSGAIELE